MARIILVYSGHVAARYIMCEVSIEQVMWLFLKLVFVFIFLNIALFIEYVYS